jgi:hypothetical protein
MTVEPHKGMKTVSLSLLQKYMWQAAYIREAI